MKITWTTPAGNVPALCLSILKQPHILIAGATGSGKSVVINSTIYTALYKSPAQCKLVLIDPKRVELVKYRNLPHTLAYASEPYEIFSALAGVERLMESRYKAMQRRGEVKSQEAEVYVVIDEFADLMTTQKKETLPILCRLAQLGRAANVHLIIATQRPTRDIVNGQIKVNMDCRLALRCPSPRDSINIIDQKGAEALPRYGYGYYQTPEGLQLVQIPMIAEDELQARIDHWEGQNRLTRWLWKTKL